jgi:hypothetical protein
MRWGVGENAMQWVPLILLSGISGTENDKDRETGCGHSGQGVGELGSQCKRIKTRLGYVQTASHRYC